MHLPSAHRPDVDGLRAIAVLSVVLYHLKTPGVSGGFVGVDIFFVISGYLISRIILDELSEQRFSFVGFYARRVKRILPALVVVTAAIVATAFLVLEPYEITHVLAATSALSVLSSNIYFASSGGYFEAPLAANPLLHTWSLSVEEQFYLLYPLCLAALFRWARGAVPLAMFAMAVVSFALAEYASRYFPEKAFFLTHMRVGEFLVGALVAACRDAVPKSDLARTGISLVAAGVVIGTVFGYTELTPFPGLSAVPVCIATALLIYAGRGATTPVHALLSTRPMVGVGLISYSVYLVHWPLIVFTKRLSLGDLSIAASMLIFAGSMLIAYGLWRWVEQPMRALKTRPLSAVGVAVASSVAVVAISLVGDHVISQQLNEVTEVEKAKRAAVRDPCILTTTTPPSGWNESACSIGEAGPAIAVWGDSHAAHYFPALRELAARDRYRFVLLGASGCPPLPALPVRERVHCASFNAMVMAYVRRARPAVVVLSANWANYEKRSSMFGQDVMSYLREAVANIEATGAKVVIVGSTPTFPIEVPVIARTSQKATRSSYPASYSKLFDATFSELKAAGDVRLVRPHELFCSDTMLCTFRDDAQLYFWDRTHLTAHGAAIVLPRVMAAITAALADASGPKLN